MKINLTKTKHFIIAEDAATAVRVLRSSGTTEGRGGIGAGSSMDTGTHGAGLFRPWCLGTAQVLMSSSRRAGEVAWGQRTQGPKVTPKDGSSLRLFVSFLVCAIYIPLWKTDKREGAGPFSNCDHFHMTSSLQEVHRKGNSKGNLIFYKHVEEPPCAY